MVEEEHFISTLIINTKELDIKKLFRSFLNQYFERGSLTLYQRELLTVEAIKQKISIPSSLEAIHLTSRMIPDMIIFKFIKRLSNNVDPKFKKRIRNISHYYKNCGWLSIKQREIVYISAYKQEVPIPKEFKKLTSEKEEKDYIDATNIFITT